MVFTSCDQNHYKFLIYEGCYPNYSSKKIELFTWQLDYVDHVYSFSEEI